MIFYLGGDADVGQDLLFNKQLDLIMNYLFKCKITPFHYICKKHNRFWKTQQSARSANYSKNGRAKSLQPSQNCRLPDLTGDISGSLDQKVHL